MRSASQRPALVARGWDETAVKREKRKAQKTRRVPTCPRDVVLGNDLVYLTRSVVMPDSA